VRMFLWAFNREEKPICRMRTTKSQKLLIQVLDDQ
jgi:hypothetical protein